MPPRTQSRSVPAASVLLGVGLAAFFDGIVFHMLLEWHHMVSNVTPPVTLDAMHVNTFWDGVFHAGAWVAVVVGLALLLGAVERGERLPNARAVWGRILLGAGAFNLVEGLVDHHLLRLHHVRDVPFPLPYDLTFLIAGGVLLMALGWGMAREEGRYGR